MMNKLPQLQAPSNVTNPAAACHPRAPDAKMISTPWEKKKVSLQDIELEVNSLKEFRFTRSRFARFRC